MKTAFLALALLASSACASSQAQNVFFKKRLDVPCTISQEKGNITELLCDHNNDGRTDFWYEARYEEKPKYGAKKLLLYSKTQVDLNFDGLPDEETVCNWEYSLREGKYLDRSWKCVLQEL